MDRKYIDDHHIIARYLANQLSEDELQAFEDYYVERPELVRELEAAARFKVGLMQLRDNRVLDGLMKKAAAPIWRSPWLAAAAVAVAVGAGYLGTYQAHLQPSLVASRMQVRSWLGTPLPITETYAMERLRGSYDAEIKITEATQLIELRVLPEYRVQPARYRIRLQALQADGSVQLAAEVENVPTDATGFVTAVLNTARVEGGRYQLVISDEKAPDSPAARSTFNILIRDLR